MQHQRADDICVHLKWHVARCLHTPTHVCVCGIYLVYPYIQVYNSSNVAWKYDNNNESLAVFTSPHQQSASDELHSIKQESRREDVAKTKDNREGMLAVAKNEMQELKHLERWSAARNAVEAKKTSTTTTTTKT